MDLNSYEITGLHRNLPQCLVKQEVSLKCIARYISIITADCMMQCAMEKRVQYEYDNKYGKKWSLDDQNLKKIEINFVLIYKMTD